MSIKGQNIVLRAVEPSDIQYLYEWENDTSLWGVSGTVAPFSHHTLELFIEAQRTDIYSSRQMRLMICTVEGETIGALDIFEFEPQHHRAGVGIVIAPTRRGKGYALDALKAIESYARLSLEIHQLWCNIEEDNAPSLALFAKAGYEKVGVKREWNYTPNGYKSEILFQRLLD